MVLAYDLYDLSRLRVHTLFPYEADGPAHITCSSFYCDVHKRGFLLYLKGIDIGRSHNRYK